MKIKKNTDQKQVRNPYGFIQFILTVLIIILGVVGAAVFIKFKKQPEKVEQTILAPLVNVQRITASDIPIIVHGYGTSQPKVQIDIIPEVAGKIVYIHPELKVGGFIKAGETILKIDSKDYELALSQSQSAVENAKEQLEREKAEALVAKKEWSQMHGDAEPDSILVLREPQIKRAESALSSAESQLAAAQLKVDRTTIKLDFDILVTSENVDIQQYVVTGQSLAKAYGTKAMEIVVPLEDQELAWFNAFEHSQQTSGNQKHSKQPEVTVKADFAGAEQTWKGKVVRTSGQVDRTSRMVSIIIEVENPFGVPQGKAPLLPGIFAEVLIHGKTLRNALAIPREAVHEGDKIWVVNSSKINIKTLNIVRKDRKFVYAISETDSQLDLITSSLDAVTNGLEVRIENNPENEQPEGI
jgi:RND family efflux transporter MFP subunit